MATTKADIKRWLQEGKDEGATHLIVMTDTFEWEDYPIYVKGTAKEARAEVEQRNGKNMQRVTEIYNISKDWDEQLSQHRSFNY